MNDPRYMPIEQEKGIVPLAVGVNSMIFSPLANVLLMPSDGTTMLEAQVKEDSEVITHLTGTPALIFKVLGE
mgnify:CR=1 FL=1